MDSRPDAVLVRAYRNGDAAAFDALLERHSGPLFGYLLRMVGHRDDAEDLFQETMVRVLHGIHDHYREENHFRAWLFRVAHHLTIDFLRRRRTHTSLDDPDAEGDGGVGRVEPVDRGPSPFEHTADRQDWARVTAAVLLLTPEQQEIFWMRVVGELSFAEIAEALGCPLNTALGRMHDAVCKVRIALRETDLAPAS